MRLLSEALSLSVQMTSRRRIWRRASGGDGRVDAALCGAAARERVQRLSGRAGIQAKDADGVRAGRGVELMRNGCGLGVYAAGGSAAD